MNMSIEEVNEEYFEEYKKLGGKSNKTKYLKNLDIFIEETLDIWVYGDPIKHDNRSDSMYAVSDIAKIPMKEVNLIFESVDNIHTYT